MPIGIFYRFSRLYVKPKLSDYRIEVLLSEYTNARSSATTR
jgi:hypothetical protein